MPLVIVQAAAALEDEKDPMLCFNFEVVRVERSDAAQRHLREVAENIARGYRTRLYSVVFRVSRQFDRDPDEDQLEEFLGSLW